MMKNRGFIAQSLRGDKSKNSVRKNRSDWRFDTVFARFAALSALLMLAALPASAGEGAQVAVQQGTLRGQVTDHREFRRIPFAAPPVGDLRFRPPQVPAAWSGVRDATRFGGPCPQAGRVGSPASTNEDCLFLNVYTPLEGENLPVMVWIHGGGFTSSTANSYTGATLAKKGQMIVVTIDYRLGVLGLLANPGMAAESADGASGNFALLDQQAALRWIKTNISAFGGNPDNVTIAGQSAGGSSVCAHLIAPGSKDLFHKAIIQSGFCNKSIATRDTSYRVAKAFATDTQCANDDPARELACLRALPVDRILAVQGADNFASNDAKWQLHVDGSTLKSTFGAAVRSGQFNRVPVIAGSTRVEGYGFAYIGFKMARKELTTELYRQLIGGAFFNANADKVLAEYPPSNYPTLVDAYSAVLGDAAFSCDARSIIRELAGQGVTVYAYEFRDPEPPTLPNVSLGPVHGADLLYVFQDKLSMNGPAALSAPQLQLSNQMQSYWTSFARTGDPNAGELPKWKTYSSKDDRFFGFTSVPPGNGDFAGFSAEHHCDFWADTYR